MKVTAHGGSSGAEVRLVVVPPLLLILLATWAAPAAARQPVGVIVLPGASSAEGIAAGRGTTFHAGDLLQGRPTQIEKGGDRHGTVKWKGVSRQLHQLRRVVPDQGQARAGEQLGESCARDPAAVGSTVSRAVDDRPRGPVRAPATTQTLPTTTTSTGDAEGSKAGWGSAPTAPTSPQVAGVLGSIGSTRWALPARAVEELQASERDPQGRMEQ